MRTIEEIIKNAVVNIDKSHDMQKPLNRESIESLGLEELRNYAFSLSCEFVDVLFEIGQLVEFIKFADRNQVVKNHD